MASATPLLLVQTLGRGRSAAERAWTGVNGMRRCGGVIAAVAVGLALGRVDAARASDHFDSPAMTANPQADIGDVYAWTSADGLRLNVVMTIAGHSFSDRLRYALHID